jgi:hypothetical protein
MSEKSSREDGKSGSPKSSRKSGVGSRKVSQKSEVESLKSETEKPSAADRHAPTEPKEPMEVHHHPDLHHEKKPWKEYLLEGLMIFLAVTLGFFAESLREHINEKSRAQDFAVALYADLKADTAEMHGYLKYHKVAVANIDTLMQLVSDNDPKQVPPAKLYWFGLWGGAFRVFIPHDATLTEMKNSGSLRFFANLKFNSKLEQYDQLCQNLKSFETLSAGTYTEVRKFRAQLFNFKYNAIINNISAIKDTRLRRMKVDSFLKTNPPLLNTDKVLFNQYVEMVRSRFLDRNVLMGTDILNHADSLIIALKKKYDVEEGDSQ